MNRKFLGVLFASSVCLFPVASFAQAIGGGQGGTPGPAANASSLSGCVYIAAGITLADPRIQAGLQCDPSGNLKVTVSGGSGANQNVNIAAINGAAPSLTNPIFTAYAEAGDTTGTFTNATQSTAITATNADGYATALVSINGTYGTATGTFQASDDGGATFYTMSCVRSDGSAVETGYTTLTNTNRQWFCPVSGNDSFRIQSSAVASGTVNARISISAPPTNSAVVSGPTGTGANQVQGTSAAGATDDGSNPVKVGGVFNSTATIITTGQRGNFQMSAQGGLGIAALNGVGYASLYTLANTPNTGVGTLSAGLVSAFNTTLPTYTNGQYGALQMGVRGGLHVDLYSPDLGQTPYGPTNADAVATTSTSQYLVGGSFDYNFNGTTFDRTRNILGALAAGSAGTGTTAVEESGTLFSEITSATTTAVKGTPAILHQICVNTLVGAATIKAYNATTATGTPITITLPATITGDNPFCVKYDIYMSTALTVVTSGATDVTVTYH